MIWSLGAVSKLGFWFKSKAGLSLKPQAYLQYSEDLKLGPNVEIGPKGNLETVPNDRTNLKI